MLTDFSGIWWDIPDSTCNKMVYSIRYMVYNTCIDIMISETVEFF